MESDVVADEASQPEESRSAGSLADRMAQRAQELQTKTTERFPIPTWEGILEVELTLVSWERLRRVAGKYQRLDDAHQELYTAAEQLLLASQDGAFYEIPPGGGEPVLREDLNWVGLARNTGKPLPEDLTPRQAVIVLCGDIGALTLWRDWGDWVVSRKSEVDEEVSQYFETTQ